ncbi:enkurin [Stomoxys calcitrans]|uniref:enkurin n=1 Tax=Stomoxys calcitrans TaxID=35570 RepID=UPI0027E2B946|nr:enkurin [Stomoxys calcitrans]
MSLVYITYHDENISDVDNDNDYLKSRRPRLKYNSKFKEMVREEKNSRHVIEMPNRKKLLTSSAKNSHQTMGYAVTPVELPCNFLKKNQGVKWQRLNEHQCPPHRHIPPVPQFQRHQMGPHHHIIEEIKKDQKEELFCPRTRFLPGHKHRANFVALNVELIKKAETRRPPPRYIDTAKGDRHSLLNSGLIPQYICSKKFGKVPCYLDARKKILNQLTNRCLQQTKMEAENACARYMPTVKKLSSEERKEILEGLRTNFTNLFKIYQSLSVCTDTVTKQLKKGKMENELRQLEQDIHLMEHNPEIYVSAY